MRSVFAIVLVVLGVLIAIPGTASAHAQLVSTTPAANSVVDVSPTEIRLQFSENVSAAPGALRLYGAAGQRIDDGRLNRPVGEPSVVSLPVSGLANGGYAFTWRVTSADSHPINGAFFFNVGTNEEQPNDSLRRDVMAADQAQNPGASVGSDIARTVMFAALLVLVGAVVFILFVERSSSIDRRVRTAIVVSGAALGIGSVAGLLIQGPYAAGLGLGHVFNLDLIDQTLNTKFGMLALARCVLAAILVAMLLGSSSRKSLLWASAPLAMAVLASVTLYGHAVTGRWVPLAIAADLAHMAGAAAWIGGLTLLVVRGFASSPPGVLLERICAFSRVAVVSVIVIVVTGVFQGWRQLGSIDAVFDSRYGVLLAVKVVLVAVLVWVAKHSRKWVNARYTPEILTDNTLLVRSLKKLIVAEVTIGVVVVVVTALLVNAVPSASTERGPQSAVIDVASYQVQVTIDPAETGRNEVHVYVLNDTGSLADVENVDMSLSLSGSDIGGIDIPLSDVGPGHLVAYGMSIPIKGEWSVKIDLLVDNFTKASGNGVISVRQ